MTGDREAKTEFWTPRYWQGYWHSRSIYRRYNLARDRELAVGLLTPGAGELVLEVGCGYGRISAALLASARITLIAVDSSREMLRSRRGRAEMAGQACQADALRLPFRSGVFDAVICNGVLTHVDDERVALGELVRVLRPDGRLVISGNNRLSPMALPVALWMSLKPGVRQTFRTPWFYLRQLRGLGVEVRRVATNTLLAQGLQVPGTDWSLVPACLFRLLRSLDRLAERRPFCLFGYETWILGVKRRSGH